MAPTEIATIAKDEEAKARATLALAFSEDPVMRWIMPEASAYLQNVSDAQFALGGRALEHGGAHCTADFSAVALWLPPGVGVDEEAMGAFMGRAAPADIMSDLMGVAEQMGQFHPEAPHWYLAVLGVDASRQGKGLGALLMKHALARIDREHAAAYLESSNPRNIPFYERHGFEVVGAIQCGSSPTITPMLRLPR